MENEVGTTKWDISESNQLDSIGVYILEYLLIFDLKTFWKSKANMSSTVLDKKFSYQDTFPFTTLSKTF